MHGSPFVGVLRSIMSVPVSVESEQKAICKYMKHACTPLTSWHLYLQINTFEGHWTGPGCGFPHKSEGTLCRSAGGYGRMQQRAGSGHECRQGGADLAQAGTAAAGIDP